MFATGMGPVADSAFAITSMLIAIPTGVKIFSWIATVWGGSLRMTTAFYFALGMVLEFTIGGLSGIMHASAPIDLQQTDSYFVVAHFHYVLFGGVMFAILSALLLLVAEDQRPHDGRDGWQVALLADGRRLQSAPFSRCTFSAMWGMPRRIYTYAPDMGWASLNQFETVCAFILGIAFLLFYINIFKSLLNGERRRGRSVGRTQPRMVDAVAAATYNFATIPQVRGRDAFWWTSMA